MLTYLAPWVENWFLDTATESHHSPTIVRWRRTTGGRIEKSSGKRKQRKGQAERMFCGTNIQLLREKSGHHPTGIGRVCCISPLHSKCPSHAENTDPKDFHFPASRRISKIEFYAVVIQVTSKHFILWLSLQRSCRENSLSYLRSREKQRCLWL